MKFENHMPIYIQIVDQLKKQLIMKEKKSGRTTAQCERICSPNKGES